MISGKLHFIKKAWIATSAACILMLGCAEVDGVDDVAEQQQALSCAQHLSQEDRVERGRWMTSTVDYEPVGGEARVQTTVSNSRSLVGWTGGVVLVFVDHEGAPLYATEVQTRGVDACGFR